MNQKIFAMAILIVLLNACSNQPASNSSSSSSSSSAPVVTTTVRDSNARNVTTMRGSNTNSLAWSHIIEPGSNRMLLVSITKRAIITVGTVTYGGVGLTKLAEAEAGIGNFPHAELWYLLEPAVGTNDIVATLSNTSAIDFWQASAIDWIGINQTTPFGTPATAGGTNGNASVTATAMANDLVIDVLAYDHHSSNAMVGPGQIAKWSDSCDLNWKGAGSTEAGAASVIMSWTVPAGGIGWAQIAVAVKPAP